MLNNAASALVVTATNPASPVLNQFSLFAQDDWKMSKALSLSLGLRWDLAPPPKGKRGQDAYTILGDVNTPASLRVAPRGTPLWHTGWYNFAPRAGVAWAENSEPGRELIVRAGGGVFLIPAINRHCALSVDSVSQTRFILPASRCRSRRRNSTYPHRAALPTTARMHLLFQPTFSFPSVGNGTLRLRRLLAGARR